MGVGAPMNHVNPSKDPKSKRKHEINLAVFQKKAFSISSLVSKSSEVASKDPQVVATAASKAEIALAVKLVTSHISARGMEEFPQLMLFIFPDSQIAKQLLQQLTKLGYVVSHDLVP